MGGLGSGRHPKASEPRGSGARVVSWRLHRKQLFALQARRSERFQELLFGGAVRGGKTFFFARDAALAGLVDYPGDTFCLIRKELASLKSQLWKELRRVVRELVPASCILRDAVSPRPELEVLVQTPLGETKTTRWIGRDGTDPTRIMGEELRGIYVDEGHEIASEFFEILPTRFSHEAGARDYHYIYTATNPAPGRLKRVFIDEPEPHRIFIPSTIFDNTFIDRQSAIDRITTGFGMSKGNLRRYLYGQWEEFEGKVFKEWKAEVHVQSFELGDPKGHYHLQGFDHGYTNPSCILFGAMDSNGVLRIYHEIYGAGLSPERIASEYHKTCDQYRVPDNQRLLIADNSIRKPERDGISIWNDLTERGVPLKMADKQKKGIYTIQGMIEREELFVHRRCRNLRREIPEQRFAPQSPAAANAAHKPETMVDCDNHAVDALKYVVNYAVAAGIRKPRGPGADSAEGYVRRALEEAKAPGAGPLPLEAPGKGGWDRVYG